MATIANKDGGGGELDRKLTTPNRKNAGSPAGSLTPLYSGEIVQDTTNNTMWYALGLTNTDWVPYVLDL